MSVQVSASSIEEWIISETEQLDLITNWEEMLGVYAAMQFTDPLTDKEKIEEFKWIINQTNKVMTSMRRCLLGCRDLEAMMEYLKERTIPKGDINLSDRKALAFQKLRQRWVLNMIHKMEQMLAPVATTKEDVDVWASYAAS